jgi:branched-chain amino acid transport system substrate-binding protein
VDVRERTNIPTEQGGIKEMKSRKLVYGLLGAAAIGGATLATPAVAQDSVVIPLLSYRTGPYAPNGIPFANGTRDVMAYVNKTGGIDGTKVDYQECETGYKTDLGVQCYESLKSKGAIVMIPLSTGITYKLVPKAAVDQIPVHSMGYGMSAGADGSYFPWIFNFPTTRRSASSSWSLPMAASRFRFCKPSPKSMATKSSCIRCRASRCRISGRSGARSPVGNPTG